MSSTLFRVTTHVVPGQHVREYPRGTNRDQNAVLYLSVKQYTPIRETESLEGAVTIIGAHANGFPKEMYEPLWDEVLRRSKGKFQIRNIWIADVAHQGDSYVLNEDRVGNDPSWFDASRDVLQIINHFRAEMPRPLVGIGHSFGACHLINLSLFHPRLFSALVMIDPVIEPTMSQANAEDGAGNHYGAAHASTFRRDRWPSRAAAREAFTKNPFYQRWDPRVLEAWVTHGLREVPTAIYPEVPSPGAADVPVTLKTPKHQEVWTFLRPNFKALSENGERVWNWKTHPDTNPSEPIDYPFYRPEPRSAYLRLGNLRPPTFYIQGSASNISPLERKRDKVMATGIGPWGNGGLAEGRTADVLLDGIGHLVPMEETDVTAQLTVDWLAPLITEWRDDEDAYHRATAQRSASANYMIDGEWKWQLLHRPGWKGVARRQAEKEAQAKTKTKPKL